MSDRLDRAGQIRAEREPPQRVTEGMPPCGGSRCRIYSRTTTGRWEEHDRSCPAWPVEEDGEEDRWLWLTIAGLLLVVGIICLLAAIL